MKTQKELETIKEEFNTLNEKLMELTEDELLQVTGGLYDMPERRPANGSGDMFEVPDAPGPGQYEFHIYKLGKNE